MNSMAVAQPEPVAHVQYESQGWNFSPALSGMLVEGFLAWPTEEVQTQGGNVRVLWYQREGIETWSTWGWDGDDLGRAGRWVREFLLDDGVFDDDPDLAHLIDAVDPQSVEPPRRLLNGLYEGDPMQAVVGVSEEPGETLDTLAFMGWETAPWLSPLAVCAAPEGDEATSSEVALLNELAADAELTVYGHTDIEQDPGLFCKCKKSWGTWTPSGPMAFCYSSIGIGGQVSCFYLQEWTNTGTLSGKKGIFCGTTCSGTVTDTRCLLAELLLEPGSTCPATLPPGTPDKWIKPCLFCP